MPSLPSPTLSEMDFDKHDSSATCASGTPSSQPAVVSSPETVVASTTAARLPAAASASPHNERSEQKKEQKEAKKEEEEEEKEKEKEKEPQFNICIPSNVEPTIGLTQLRVKKVAKNKVDKPILSRYLPEAKGEAFIGPMLKTVKETIQLVKRECPSLSTLSDDQIALKIRFDGNTTQSVQDVLFRVLPQAWPNAVSDVLPLIYVEKEVEKLVVGERVGVDQGVRAAVTGSTANETTIISPSGSGAKSHIPSSPPPGVRSILDLIEEAKNKSPLPPLHLLSNTDKEQQYLSWDELVKDGTLLGMQGWTDQTSKKKRQ